MGDIKKSIKKYSYISINDAERNLRSANKRYVSFGFLAEYPSTRVNLS